MHAFFDALGHRTSVMGNVYAQVYEKDERGRNIALRFFDRSAERTEDRFKTWVYRWHHQRDGSVIEAREDRDGRLIPLRGDFQFLRTRMAFGADGYVAVLQNVDEAGGLVNAPCGAATLRYFYDANGRFSRWEVYDRAGRPAIGPSSTAGEQNRFEGYELSDILFFDTRAPVRHWSGAERWHFETDRFGNRTALRFHRIERPRDPLGLLVEVRYLGVDGALIDRKDNGIARVVRRYDERGVRVQTTSFDQGGQPQKGDEQG